MAKEEGLKEGLKEGYNKGLTDRNIQIAKNLLKDNRDISLISKNTSLDEETIKKIK